MCHLLLMSDLERLLRVAEHAMVRRAIWGLPAPIVFVGVIVIVGAAILKYLGQRGGGR